MKHNHIFSPLDLDLGFFTVQFMPISPHEVTDLDFGGQAGFWAMNLTEFSRWRVVKDPGAPGAMNHIYDTIPSWGEDMWPAIHHQRYRCWYICTRILWSFVITQLFAQKMSPSYWKLRKCPTAPASRERNFRSCTQQRNRDNEITVMTATWLFSTSELLLHNR